MKLLRLEEVIEMTGLSRSSIYRYGVIPRFPSADGRVQIPSDGWRRISSPGWKPAQQSSLCNLKTSHRGKRIIDANTRQLRSMVHRAESFAAVSCGSWKRTPDNLFSIALSRR